MLTFKRPNNTVLFIFIIFCSFYFYLGRSEGTDTINVTVQQPIKQVTFSSDSPMQYPSNTINFVMGLNGLPSSVTYDITYGDGLRDFNLILVDGVNIIIFNHTYASPGIYEVNVMLHNQVSYEVVSVKVGILEDIKNVSLLAYTQQNSYARPQQVLPKEHIVKFHTNADAGTVEYVTWEIDSNSINTTSIKHLYKFMTVGWYNITATVGNTYTKESISISVQILESVTSLYLVNNGPVHLGDNITYVLFCKQRGSFPSYNVDMADGTELNLTILQKNPNVSDYLATNLRIPFNINEYFSTVFSHFYENEGRYVATATGWNPVSYVSSTYEAFIQSKPCVIWDINIRDGGSNYDSATIYKRSKPFIFTANVDVDCREAKKADYQWQFYAIDDIFSVPSTANEVHLPKHVNSKVTDLYIPKYLLVYGRYIFELTVEMIMRDGSIGVSDRDQSYIEVVQTPLVAKISGGSAIHVGWSSNITLNGSDSFDADWEEDYDGEYHWYCHLANETLPSQFDIQQELPTAGGCLGTGMHLQSGNNSILIIKGETLQGNDTYTFHLAVSKPGRTDVGWAKQIISVMPGSPPVLAIQCVHNCGRYMNPSERFALVGICTHCSHDTKNKYTWTLWSDSMLPDHLVGYRRVFHGRRKAFLSFPVDMFVGIATFSLRLRIDSWNGESSKAEYTFTTISPPSQGNCTVIPSEGIVMQTRFTIECQGYSDPHGPLLYVAHVYTGIAESDTTGNIEGSVTYYGVDPIFPPTLLPVGQPSSDFSVTIKIKVSNNVGASVHITTYVKVKAPAPENQTEPVEDTMLPLVQGDESELSQLIASGSIQSAIQLVTSITSRLNAEADKPTGDDGATQTEKLEKRQKILESLIDALAQVEVRDMESLEQVSAAIAQVTQQQQQVTINALVKLNDMYLGMGDFLKDQSDSIDVGGQAVELCARSLVSGLSNMLGAVFTEIKQVNKTSTLVDGVNETENRMLKARDVTMGAMSALKDIQAVVLHTKVPGDKPTQFTTDSLRITLARYEYWQLDGLGLESESKDFMFQLPDKMNEQLEDGNDSDDIIDTQMYNFKNNPFSWTTDSDQVTSQVVGLQFTRGDQSEVVVKDLSNTIDLYLPNFNASSSPILPTIHPVTNQTLYAFNWTNSDASVFIQVEHDGDGLKPEIVICIQFENPPNATHNIGCKTLPQVKSSKLSSWNASNTSPYSWLLSPDDVTHFGVYYFSVERLERSDVQMHIAYAFQTQCIYWDGEQEGWNGDGCRVGPYTSISHTHCQCNHLTFFALSSSVLPNAVYLAADVIWFLSFWDNPVTVAAVCSVFVLYAVVAIWARKKDKIEEQRAKVIYLKDNDPRAHYRYHITIFTGMRRNAGTTSTVTITLHGNFGSSIPHILSAKNLEILQRNSVDSFLLTTFQSLGILTSVRLWHDNGGASPEWYVSRILVHDLESSRWWYFLCRSWLAVDLGGCKIDKTFPVALPEDLNEFHNIVLSKSTRDLKDNHVWFSVFMKPPQSYFTRLQRASCCLQILLTSMTMSIIFYEAPENPNWQNLEFGSFQISQSVILIGIQASLMSIPLSLTIDTIFRNSRPRFVAVPDPIQAHSSISLAVITGHFGNRFRRMTRKFSQTFHFGRQESNPSQQDILLNQLKDNRDYACKVNKSDSLWSGETSSLSSTQLNVQEEFEWYRAEFRSNNQQSDIYPTNSSLVSGKMLSENSAAYSVYTSSVAESGTQLDIDTHIPGVTSPTINIQSDSSISTSSVKVHELEDEIDWYRLDLSTPLPFDLVYSNKATVVDIDDSQHLVSYNDSSHGSIHSDRSHLSANLVSIDHTRIKNDTYEEYLIDKVNECRKNMCAKPSEEFSSENGKEKAIRKLDLIMELQGWNDDRSVEDEQEDKCCDMEQGCLPWWCIYLAWTLTIISWVVCAYFIMHYGMTYGYQTSIEWLISIMVSIIQSVVIIQPIKVVILAAVFAIFLKTHQLDDVGAQFFRDWKPPKITASSEGAEESNESIQRFNFVRSVNTIFYNPPLGSSIVKAQEKRRIAAKVHAMFRAFIGHVIFVFFVLEIAYTQQNVQSYYLGKAMRDKYDGAKEVLAVSDFFDWMSYFIAETYMDGPMQVTDNRLIGSVRLRQVRVKTDVCAVPPVFKDSFSSCKSPLKTNRVDRGSYGPSWGYKLTKKHSNDPWNYQNGDTIPGSYYHIASMGYDTGGFIAHFDSNSQKAMKVLANLKKMNWINDYTWAVFVEWTTYNANVNLFSINTVLFEVDTIGSLQGSTEFSIVRLHRYTSRYDIFVRVLEGVYFIVLMAMIYRDYHKWKELESEYFDFWNGLNLVIIVSSICAIAFYVLRHSLGLQAMKQHKDDQKQFVSFSRVAFINQLVVQFIALIVFCATLKCMKVLRYNSSVFMLQQAMKNVSKQFVSLTFAILICIVCFASYARLEFGSTLFDFKTFLASFNTLFITMTGGLDTLDDVVETFPIRAGCFFIAFFFFGIFVLFQFYVSFVLASFEEARRHPMEKEDHDVIASLVDWLIHFFSVNPKL